MPPCLSSLHTINNRRKNVYLKRSRRDAANQLYRLKNIKYLYWNICQLLKTLYSPEAIIVPHEVCTLAVDGWTVTVGTASRKLGGASVHPGPSSLYQM